MSSNMDEDELQEVSDVELDNKNEGNIKLNIKNKDDVEGSDDDVEGSDDDAEGTDDEEDDDDEDEDEGNAYITDEDGEDAEGTDANNGNKKQNNKVNDEEEGGADTDAEGTEDDDDDDEEEDENYLKKFDKDLKKNYLESYHPEAYSHNFEEVKMMANVVRDENNNIIDPLHKTIPFMTKFEKSRILGQRAKQIDTGATPFVKVDKSMIDGYLIALKELEEKKIPFIIKRPLPNGGFEYWNVSDLELVC
jgi:DNA-directed RNA polymerase I, II, and III subunit RPABC2